MCLFYTFFILNFTKYLNAFKIFWTKSYYVLCASLNFNFANITRIYMEILIIFFPIIYCTHFFSLCLHLSQGIYYLKIQFLFYRERTSDIIFVHGAYVNYFGTNVHTRENKRTFKTLFRALFIFWPKFLICQATLKIKLMSKRKALLKN